MATPYRTAKFKSANILYFSMVIWGQTAKFNLRQYFWLYDSIASSLAITQTYILQHQMYCIVMQYIWCCRI